MTSKQGESPFSRFFEANGNTQAREKTRWKKIDARTQTWSKDIADIGPVETDRCTQRWKEIPNPSTDHVWQLVKRRDARTLRDCSAASFNAIRTRRNARNSQRHEQRWQKQNK